MRKVHPLHSRSVERRSLNLAEIRSSVSARRLNGRLTILPPATMFARFVEHLYRTENQPHSRTSRLSIVQHANSEQRDTSAAQDRLRRTDRESTRTQSVFHWSLQLDTMDRDESATGAAFATPTLFSCPQTPGTVVATRNGATLSPLQ